jgi:hypothetical protein
MRSALLGSSLFLAAPLLASCSDPVPPTPRGAWTVSFIDPGIECQHAGHNAQVGEVTDRTKQTLLSNGQDDAEVECIVSGSGSFKVDASAYQSSKLLKIVVPSLTSAATIDAPAKGTVAFASPNTVKSYVSPSNSCDFYFVEGSGEGVGEGKVWVAFKCEEIRLANESVCEIQQGYAIFENCSTSTDAEEE